MPTIPYLVKVKRACYMNREYKPIHCDFYEELEALATLHKSSEIVFRNKSGARSVIHERIAYLYTRDGVERLRTASGLEIRLDHLIQVDGKILANNC
jgi:Rho-binding antiterminator